MWKREASKQTAKYEFYKFACQRQSKKFQATLIFDASLFDSSSNQTIAALDGFTEREHTAVVPKSAASWQCCSLQSRWENLLSIFGHRSLPQILWQECIINESMSQCNAEWVKLRQLKCDVVRWPAQTLGILYGSVWCNMMYEASVPRTMRHQSILDSLDSLDSWLVVEEQELRRTATSKSSNPPANLQIKIFKIPESQSQRIADSTPQMLALAATPSVPQHSQQQKLLRCPSGRFQTFWWFVSNVFLIWSVEHVGIKAPLDVSKWVCEAQTQNVVVAGVLTKDASRACVQTVCM